MIDGRSDVVTTSLVQFERYRLPSPGFHLSNLQPLRVFKISVKLTFRDVVFAKGVISSSQKSYKLRTHVLDKE